jgi:hypothetical protein
LISLARATILPRTQEDTIFEKGLLGFFEAETCPFLVLSPQSNPLNE